MGAKGKQRSKICFGARESTFVEMGIIVGDFKNISKLLDVAIFSEWTEEFNVFLGKIINCVLDHL